MDYQADFSTMVRSLGIELPASVALALRLAAALGTLALACRAKQTGDGRSFAFAVLILCHRRRVKAGNRYRNLFLAGVADGGSGSLARPGGER